MQYGDLRTRLLRTSMIAGLTAILASGAALAQDVDELPPEPEGEENAQTQADPAVEDPPVAQTTDSAEDVILVTGSRISRPEFSQPTPVSVVGQDELDFSGTQNLGDILADLPALGSTGTVRGNTNSFDDSAGLNQADLRRLGVNRTLTLVNGKRHVGGDAGSTAVDLNSIPAALVERVEVITGGASAIYGSDAVSGVVNIILKDDFEGFEGNIEVGAPMEDTGYGENYTAGFLAGTNFQEGRGNITVAARYDRSERVDAFQLDYLRDYGTIINPEDTGEADGIPDRLTVPFVGSEVIDENGVIPLAGFFGAGPNIGFNDDGTAVIQPTRTGENSFAFGQLPGDCETCFFLEDWITIAPDIDRLTLNSTFDYEIVPDFNFYGDLKYVNTEVYEILQPSFDFGGRTVNVNENPFVPELVQQEAAALDLTDVPVARFFADADGGGRSNDIERETYRAVLGFDGEFETSIADFTHDTYYIYGETSNLIRGNARAIPRNLDAAYDVVIDPATGQPACRNQVPSAQGPDYVDPAVSEGCVPYNPFGQQNTQAALDFSFTDTLSEQTLTQELFGTSWVTDSSKFFELPGGPIGLAFGGEYREESSANVNDALTKAGLTESAAQPDEVGGYDVIEGFAEVSLPILADMKFAEELTVDGAIRVGDYDPFGSVTAWKLGGSYTPLEDVTFRGTYSEAVRAPNITEAFQPTSPGFFGITDPCDADNIDDDPDRRANCAALGIPDNFQANDNVSVLGESSGNPNLDPEDSTSYTFGAVFRPRWVEGLIMSVDWYSIEITDAILFISGQTIVDNCVDASGGPDDSFCSLFTRDATNNIDFVRSTYVNASKIETQGIDFQVQYSRGLSDWTSDTGMAWLDGELTLGAKGNYLERLNFFEFQNQPDDVNKERGELGDPILQLNLNASYSDGPLTFRWDGRFIDDQLLIARGEDQPEDQQPYRTDKVFYHDVSVSYEFNFAGNDDTTHELYAGINNLFDEEPPSFVQPIGGGAIYDALGRYMYGGVRIRF